MLILWHWFNALIVLSCDDSVFMMFYGFYGLYMAPGAVFLAENAMCTF